MKQLSALLIRVYRAVQILLRGAFHVLDGRILFCEDVDLPFEEQMKDLSVLRSERSQKIQMWIKGRDGTLGAQHRCLPTFRYGLILCWISRMQKLPYDSQPKYSSEFSQNIYEQSQNVENNDGFVMKFCKMVGNLLRLAHLKTALPAWGIKVTNMVLLYNRRFLPFSSTEMCPNRHFRSNATELIKQLHIMLVATRPKVKNLDDMNPHGYISVIGIRGAYLLR